MRRVSISVMAALLALSALAPAVSADDPVVVHPCFNDEGPFYLDEGQDMLVHCGWGANAKGLVQAYLTSVEITLTLTAEDGSVVWESMPKDLRWEKRWERASDYDDPLFVCHPDVGWSVGWYYDAGPLDAGTYRLTETHTLRHPVTDGWHQCWYDGERISPQPSLYSGTDVTWVTIIVGD